VSGKIIGENSLALIVYKDRKYLKKVEHEKAFHGKGGILPFSAIIGMPYGIQYGGYEVFEPTLEDLVMYGVRRETQIIFPKDAAFVCLKLNVFSGSRMVEVGTGSGAMTLYFSRAVGPSGCVVSIEKEERHHKNARKNIEKFAEWENTRLLNQDVSEFEDEPFDAAFIDVREPWLHIGKMHGLLKPGRVLGTILPTANQVSEMLRAMQSCFGDIEVVEILFRKYKPVVERLRPEDRMIGHTGYLIFGRKLQKIAEDATEQ
jgi:tRNA (adenine57-N1/adenine58-N1)-methyltransferase catalytic subunit